MMLKDRAPAVLTAGVLLLLAAAQSVAGAANYVTRVAPTWLTLLGAALCLLASLLDPRSAAAAVGGIAATVLLLPAAVLTVFDMLRLTGAIPDEPVDWLSTAVSVAAVLAVALLWRRVNPLRDHNGDPRPISRWVVLLGLVAAGVYPLLKTYWLLGGGWIRPEGLGTEIDGAFLGPIVLALAGGLACLIALRWWDRPAPAFAYPLATMGGLTLAGLGLGGTYATFTHPDDEGVLIGLLVYGGWLVWGLCTLAIAARLSARRFPGRPS